MKKITPTLKRYGPLLAMAAMVMTVPYNMGGCAAVTSQIGEAVGGREGGVIGNAAGKLVENESISEKDEQAMGESVAMAVTTRYPIVRDQKLNQYVALVGLTLANASRRHHTLCPPAHDPLASRTHARCDSASLRADRSPAT